MSAFVCDEETWASKSQRPSEMERRYSTMLSKPPIKVSSSLRTGSSSAMCNPSQSLIPRDSFIEGQEAHGLVELHEASELVINAHCFRGNDRDR